MKVIIKSNRKYQSLEFDYYVNGVKKENNIFELNEGNYKITIEQFHPLNNKLVFCLWPFYIIALLINGEREMLRMNKFFSYAEFDINIEKDVIINFEMNHKRKNFFYDTYKIHIIEEEKYKNIVYGVKKSIYTIFGNFIIVLFVVMMLAFLAFVIIKLIIGIF